MSDAIVVDSDSAVVSFRPLAGEERSVPVGDASQAALFQASPWRTFRWYFGQRHYSGTYWSATERDHVIYESRLELANLLLADFDTSVHHIVAQPFSLRAEVGGQLRRHIPDYLWDTDGGPVMVDVVRTERMAHPKIVLLCAWTKSIVESMGWSYLVVNAPPAIRLANVRFLSGYRREWTKDSDRPFDLGGIRGATNSAKPRHCLTGCRRGHQPSRSAWSPSLDCGGVVWSALHNSRPPTHQSSATGVPLVSSRLGDDHGGT